MIQLKGSRGVFLINTSAIELIEIGPDSTVLVTAHGRVTVPTDENLDALQRLSAEPLALNAEPHVFPF